MGATAPRRDAMTQVAPASPGDAPVAGAGASTPAALLEFLHAHPRLFVLSGAGLSTASGIPAYRDDEGRWMRRQPIDAREFARDPMARRRYWARSLVGWPLLGQARPNAGHLALARLQAAGFVQRIVTQNVDGLHQAAGSRDVLELHGNIGEVVCLDCGGRSPRDELQQRLEAANPEFVARRAAPAPDGDADLAQEDLGSFEVPACGACGGVLKPHVVFFGDAVPRQRVDAALHELRQARAVLVVGSSLMLQSGYRFFVAAQRLGIALAAINLGTTRADPLLALKVRRPCADALTELADAVGCAPRPDPDNPPEL
jgi:NAD-dependent SIR2 family protein deacetylase